MSGLDKWRGNSPSFLGSWDNLHREFDRMFRDMEGILAPMRNSDVEQGGGAMLNPACDVSETDTHYALAFDLPGVSKEDINIEAQGNQLIVSGERRREEEDRQGNYYQIEKSYGKFRRAFTLPQETDPEKVEANFSNGVLKINVPKSEARKSRKIEIGDKSGGFLGKLTGKSRNKDEDSAPH